MEFLLFLLALLTGLIIFILGIAIGSNEEADLKKEAIRRGHASYNEEGEFIWKE